MKNISAINFMFSYNLDEFLRSGIQNSSLVFDTENNTFFFQNVSDVWRVLDDALYLEDIKDNYEGEEFNKGQVIIDLLEDKNAGLTGCFVEGHGLLVNAENY